MAAPINYTSSNESITGKEQLKVINMTIEEEHSSYKVIACWTDLEDIDLCPNT